MSLLATTYLQVAQAQTPNVVVSSYVSGLMLLLGGIASLVATFFLIASGFQYITSKGEPAKLEHAKRVMRNALIGLVIVMAAGTLTAILSHAYNAGSGNAAQSFPVFNNIEPKTEGFSITDLLIKAIVGFFQHIIQTAASPFIKALDYFTHSTPLMAQNTGVFNMWLVTVGIADSLFVLLVALLGFHVMSASSLGFDEIEIKHMLPQLAFGFVFINTSIFIIDMVIELSNVMIKGIEAAFSSTGVWDILTKIVDLAGGLGLVALMIMVVFVILSVVLLVYYVSRLVTLYIGAVLSPLIALLALLPGFKDFAWTAMKTYIVNIFVLFVHVIILQLAASLFGSALLGSVQDGGMPNVLMTMIVGIATLLALIKTQGVMMQMSYVSVGPRSMRKLGDQFMKGVHYTQSKRASSRATETTSSTTASKPARGQTVREA